MKILLFVFLSLLIKEPTFAQSVASPTIGKSANLCSFAARQYLSGKSEESLALYQKAISKSESEYGKNARVVGALYYELGVRAFWLSKFNLAERSFKKAVEINPNCESAQLMLINLLRFRNRDTEAFSRAQQVLKKHPDSVSLRKDLVISLQETDPSRATGEAFQINCMQNGLIYKNPASKQLQPVESKKSDQKEASTKAKNLKGSGKQETVANKKAKIPATTVSQQEQSPAPSKAVYEPINNNSAKSARTKSPPTRKRASNHANSAPPGGLVPPPPPDSFAFAGARPGMKAKAGTIKADRSPAVPAEHNEESVKTARDHPAADSDPDFLIEWASVKKKHPPSK